MPITIKGKQHIIVDNKVVPIDSVLAEEARIKDWLSKNSK